MSNGTKNTFNHRFQTLSIMLEPIIIIAVIIAVLILFNYAIKRHTEREAEFRNWWGYEVKKNFDFTKYLFPGQFNVSHCLQMEIMFTNGECYKFSFQTKDGNIPYYSQKQPLYREISECCLDCYAWLQRIQKVRDDRKLEFRRAILTMVNNEQYFIHFPSLNFVPEKDCVQLRQP